MRQRRGCDAQMVYLVQCWTRGSVQEGHDVRGLTGPVVGGDGAITVLCRVSPDRKKLRVKDMEQYEFKPKNLLRDISQIYIHLGLPSDDATPEEKKVAEEFCRAISRDGRSYSSQLFQLASDTLHKVYAGFLAVQMDLLAEKVQVRDFFIWLQV
ncbi:UBE4A [Cordylochernes scorpioides]|uniref:RING-type E3 ubiquitin transferase n=1 Tax=Cordylochernes scorpioides TaxID=51811 RepID=A0ABY6KRD4_9ARAC|nr:UBE4A [Cordylochernes scorpioides]